VMVLRQLLRLLLVDGPDACQTIIPDFPGELGSSPVAALNSDTRSGSYANRDHPSRRA
jgi:hypothetical protein